MKDIKSFTIGFLCCACMFLLMGATSNIEQGKYQAFIHNDGSSNEDILLIDTHTGELFRKSYSAKGQVWFQIHKPNMFDSN